MNSYSITINATPVERWCYLRNHFEEELDDLESKKNINILEPKCELKNYINITDKKNESAQITDNLFQKNKLYELNESARFWLDMLWCNFSVLGRRQVWDNMNEQEREWWYSIQKNSYSKRQILIDTAENREIASKRRTVLAYRKGEFLSGTFKQVATKIDEVFEEVLLENKLK